MTSRDARTLSPDAQQAIRFRVIDAVNKGMNQGEAARVFGVSRASVNAWVKKFRDQGDAGLASAERGRPRRTNLNKAQSAVAVRALCTQCPDALGLDQALWTREALCAYLDREHDVEISVWTASRYLNRWGFLPQRPLFQAYRNAPAPVRRWFEREFPVIKARALRDKAEVLWCGDAWVRPEFFSEFSGAMCSAITGRNELSFMVAPAFTAEAFIDFAARLLRVRGRNLYLMAARHPVYESRIVQDWLNESKGSVQLHHLPADSPEDAPHLVY